jgi:hypothetical protein
MRCIETVCRIDVNYDTEVVNMPTIDDCSPDLLIEAYIVIAILLLLSVALSKLLWV